MGPKKGGNSKKEAGQERKAEAAKSKNAKAQAEKDRKEADQWKQGAAKMDKKELEEQKKQEQLRKKQERDALLAAEEAQLSAKKPTIKQKNAPIKKPAFTIRQDITDVNPNSGEYAASGIDGALDLLSLTNKSGGDLELDRHPERRMKAAFAQFEETQMPILKAENPSLRLSQLKELLQKMWKKSPENPMNQTHVEYNTGRDAMKEISKTVKEKELEKFKK
ncbi:hypothetical protein BC833DRAFT_271522 [Globomyces pollinis-pini]|nr:hypothetical protein BC833DRAFT_271522 [Globomyces pollinis-pini]